ncbi:MAG: FimB/Mfa2 family fimbrial subunit [Rikenellaceae bacterium]|nr:FimB/Mfa2 family fimbrial subunit [Rikenellaceae bacterium]
MEPEEVQIEFALEMPVQNLPTRAMSSNDENAIETVDVLVFRVDGSNETFSFRAHQTSEPVVSGNSASFLVTLKRSEADESYRLVVLANLRQEVDAVLEGIAEGTPKETLLSAITFTQTGNWPTASGSKRLFPMWGETSGHTAVARTTTLQHFGGAIAMLRSIARIDVSLNIPQENDQPGFILNRVKVYNARKTNAAAPGKSSGYNHTDQKVTSPTIVSNETISALEYTFIGSSLTQEIYIGEADNSATAPDQNVFLLVEGYYTEAGQPQNTTQPTWYRIDFLASASDPVEWYDILRNHRYQVNISYVGGPGDQDEEEAKRRGTYSMDTEILV